MKVGDNLGYFRLLSEERGSLVPALQSQPELYPDVIVFWEAFNELSTHRQSGFAANPISVADIKAYSDLMGWGAWMGSQLMKYVRALDQAYLEWVNTPKEDRGKKKNLESSPKREQIGGG